MSAVLFQAAQETMIATSLAVGNTQSSCSKYTSWLSEKAVLQHRHTNTKTSTCFSIGADSILQHITARATAAAAP